MRTQRSYNRCLWHGENLDFRGLSNPNIFRRRSDGRIKARFTAENSGPQGTSDDGSDGIYPRHGIQCRIEEISGDEILPNQGIIYASLVRLRQHGWISAEWGYSETIAKRSPIP